MRAYDERYWAKLGIAVAKTSRTRAAFQKFDIVNDRERIRIFRMNVNDKAPDFSLPDENGNTVELKQFRGKPVVLFFYPKANTPG